MTIHLQKQASEIVASFYYVSCLNSSITQVIQTLSLMSLSDLFFLYNSLYIYRKINHPKSLCFFQRCHSQSSCWLPPGAGQQWQVWTPVRNISSRSLCSMGRQRNFLQRDDSQVRNTAGLIGVMVKFDLRCLLWVCLYI